MTVARVPSFTRFATHVSIPDVPVPDTRNANDPSAAPNARFSFARMSSISLIINGSRWLMVGVAIARITRGDVRLGPGPSRMRSLSGSRLMEKFLDFRDRVAHRGVRRIGCRQERRTRIAGVDADHRERGLQSGDAIAGAAQQLCDRQQLMLQPSRLVVTPVCRQRIQPRA